MLKVIPSSLLLYLISVFLGLVCMIAPPQVHAEKADRSKPMNIESDALRYDDLKQLSIFTGKVVVTKGSILIRGARVEVRQDPEGYQFGTVTAEPGGRAFYRQKREGLDEFIEGEGELIYYDGRADTVRFSTRAEMRRYKGAQLFDESSGSVIVYDNTTDVFTVDSGSLTGVPGSGGRVRTMLTPTPKADIATVPRLTAPVSAPTLKSSDALGNKK
ncbi:MAG: lipopolysaccharide transport periplasmic protein LptA [Betaproteobacteria bacterium]|jgi:lipopolysaccharide export system protein LptA|nr:lipopolysaccharide transport periplasmic protein LptA [Betaproteobacteria bacterium]MBK7655614.1 lipopolysaccharide transport periplasmic protein LptA [Betaproteobacteria bacterium]MBP6644979.1 lipopolysaccharide transport periplasmic protein LptA [Burkholderiaceae bacterium]